MYAIERANTTECSRITHSQQVVIDVDLLSCGNIDFGDYQMLCVQLLAVCSHLGGRETIGRPVSIDQDAPAVPRGPSEQRDEEKDTKNTSPGLFVHNHTNVANSEQLRLATFSQPTFFCHHPSVPRQRAGKLQLTPPFSPLQANKQLLWCRCLDSNCGRGLE